MARTNQTGKGISRTLVAIGIALLILGMRASGSLGSDLSRFFTDFPTDRGVWMQIAGGVALILGLSGLARARSGPT